VEMVPAQDAGQGRFGDGQDHQDLGIGAALTAQSEDLGFELRAGLAGLAVRSRRAIRQASREAAFFGALQPSADRPFGDGVSKPRRRAATCFWKRKKQSFRLASAG
jgi:hypothetical protein